MKRTYALFRVNSLGDNVIFLNAAQAIRRLAPEARLIVLTNHTSRELYEGLGDDTTLLTFAKPEFFSLWKQPHRLLPLIARMAGMRIDASLVGDDQPNISLALVRGLGGRIRVGGSRPWHRIPGALTHVVPRDPHASMMHWAWETTRVFCREALAADLPPTPPAPDLSHLLAPAAPPADALVIHPGASKEYQRWPVENFVAVAKRAVEVGPVLWMDDPQAPVASLPTGVERLAPSSLTTLARTLQRARVFLGNNSGPMHLAAAVGCPMVTINGPSDPAWDPIWNASRHDLLRSDALPCIPCDVRFDHPGRCVNPDAPLGCLRAWTPDHVWPLVRARLTAA